MKRHGPLGPRAQAQSELDGVLTPLGGFISFFLTTGIKWLNNVTLYSAYPVIQGYLVDRRIITGEECDCPCSLSTSEVYTEYGYALQE